VLENITQWLDGLGDMAREIIDTPQIILLAIIFLVGWLLQFLLRRLLQTLEQRLGIHLYQEHRNPLNFVKHFHKDLLVQKQGQVYQ